jgi:SanA protein
MLYYRGQLMTSEAHFPWLWTWGTGLFCGFIFFLILFARISLKHSIRIFRFRVERPCVFAFFSIKSYLMMMIMISAGVFMRSTNAVNPLLIGIFYLIMGTPLCLSSLRFWYFGIFYKRFQEQFKSLEPGSIPPTPRWQKRLRNFLSLSLVFLVLLVAITNYWIVYTSKPWLYDDIRAVPYYKVAVIPGTSSKMGSGHENYFFKYRIQAVSELYHAGKISDVIVSGDNGTLSYNEPREMKNALVAQGVPDSAIYLDYAGFRTFDSVIRAWKIFGQKKFIFVSQKFQNERAIFIGRKHDIEIVGFNAKDVQQYGGFKTNVREVFARVKVFIDIYILNKQPKFLGDPVTID